MGASTVSASSGTVAKLFGKTATALQRAATIYQLDDEAERSIRACWRESAPC